MIAGKAEVEQPMMIVQIFKEAPLEPGIAVIRHPCPEFSKQPCVSRGNAGVNLRDVAYRGRAKRFAGGLQVTPSKPEHGFLAVKSSGSILCEDTPHVNRGTLASMHPCPGGDA